MENVLAREGEGLLAVVLYGSMARGDWSQHSDYDVLVILDGARERRFIDHLTDYGRLTRSGEVEAFPYHLAEVERMFCTFHLTTLAALREGIVLHDSGVWQQFQRRYQRLVASGELQPRGRGWQYTAEAERLAALPA